MPGRKERLAGGRNSYWMESMPKAARPGNAGETAAPGSGRLSRWRALRSQPGDRQLILIVSESASAAAPEGLGRDCGERDAKDARGLASVRNRTSARLRNGRSRRPAACAAA